MLNWFICAIIYKSASLLLTASPLCVQNQKSVPYYSTVSALLLHKGLLSVVSLNCPEYNKIILRKIHLWRSAQLSLFYYLFDWKYQVITSQQSLESPLNLCGKPQGNRTQYCFNSSVFKESFQGSFTQSNNGWESNRSLFPHWARLCPLWLVKLYTCVDLTRRRGFRPSGWAGQGWGISRGRSRLSWWGNVLRGGAHREGRGAGLADGHVISEYGSPGA